MGLIFDIHSAKLYETWYQSHRGRALDTFLRQRIPTLLNPLPGERILDVGCGSGNHLLLFDSLRLDLNGVDASPYMVNMAQQRLGTRCTVKKGMAEDLPYDDNEFDLVAFINSLEFVNDPVKVLQEAGRVARRKIFIGSINRYSWSCCYAKLQGLFCDILLKYARPYSIWELKSFVLGALGNVPISWESNQIWPGLVKKMGPFFPDPLTINHWPFGTFLALSATMTYRFKTDNIPLKIGVRKAKQSVATGMAPRQG